MIGIWYNDSNVSGYKKAMEIHDPTNYYVRVTHLHIKFVIYTSIS